MKKAFGILSSVVCVAAFMSGVADAAPAKTAKQSAIQKGTTVRAKTVATGLYDQACYDAYYGCMDQFCISDNESGGSCACSNLSLDYEKQLADIQKTLDEAKRVSTIEVEKVKAGAKADIIFAGTREYDEMGNVMSLDELENKASKDIADLWKTAYDDEEDEDFWGDGTGMGNIADKVGDDLYKSADAMCVELMDESCSSDLVLLRNMYSRQIVSDCKGFANAIAKKKSEADSELKKAEADVRIALTESLEEANKYGLGQCMIEFKKCMLTNDACGANWENCVSTIADANMQGGSERFDSSKMNKAAKAAQNTDAYGIAASTIERLEAKRVVCERVLDNCISVRNEVWPAFLREAAPTIKVAESSVESKMRQSCLTTISNCIQKACKDDIVGKGINTMDACLAYPDMAKSFCKVEIEPCEAMEPLIWTYVTDKLAAMRVDACTQEVKDCFTHENRCGANLENCIGMDYDYIHDMCPIDTLVVCKAGDKEFNMDKLDSMLMGLYLNIDNAALDQCQELVDKKMAEICGSTTDCNKFAADDVIGTGSVRSQKDGNIYRVTGMISFGSIKMGDASGSVTDKSNGKTTVLAPGQIGVKEYIEQIKVQNSSVKEADAIISAIEEELNNIAGTINRTIDMIAQDPEIQFCVSGRDLSQITGEEGAKTTARFPNLLNQVKMQIAIAALRKAQDNYNVKFTEEVAKATYDSSVDLAQYMCQKAAQNEATTLTSPVVDLAPPFASAYEVGAGLNTTDLAQGGRAVTELAGAKFKNDGYLGNSSIDADAGTKETTAVFSRETRICKICTTTVTQSCKTTGSKSWVHNNRNTECTTNDPIEVCRDIKM